MAEARCQTGKVQKADQHSHSLDSAGLDHRLGPSGTLAPQPSGHPAQRPHCQPFSTPLIFLGSMNSRGVLKRPGSILRCTAIFSIRSL